ncbi:cupin [Haloferax mucosum ATCC BAA-1512]|uniref:Cupin n=1 Tax=Haloferax mucosum ATCC BAA-1512 TaxID=662479 RepID=M0I714_9EURY|nr:cupin [Haloferax mucosum]ELZ91239.1 cupin [Haloferax mucosum ATCC BAA-1512]
MFVVLDGEATFETMDGEVSVGKGEAIRFAPGEFQSGRNDSETDLVAFSMGAPRDTEDVRIPVVCADCGHENVRLDIAVDGVTFVCPSCESEHVPAPCPDCGHDDLQLTLGETAETVVVCQHCTATFETPPIRE